MENQVMSDTAQAVQEVVEETVRQTAEHVNNFPEWFRNAEPALIRFGMKVVLSIILLWLGSHVIRLITKIVKKSLQSANVAIGAAQFVASLLKITLYAVLLFSIGAQFGLEEGTVIALLGSSALSIGFGLQGGLANLVGGFLILVFKPFQVGDYIIDHGSGCEGIVENIEICYTTLQSIDSKKIVIPNGSLSNSSISNLTANEKRRIDLKIRISYESDLLKAKSILEELVEKDPDILPFEEKYVFVDNLGESAIIMGVRAWANTKVYWPTIWRLNENIKQRFQEEGILIPYNQLDVHISSRNGKQE